MLTDGENFDDTALRAGNVTTRSKNTFSEAHKLTKINLCVFDCQRTFTISPSPLLMKLRGLRGACRSIGELHSHARQFVLNAPIHVEMFLRRKSGGNVVTLLVFLSHGRVGCHVFVLRE